MSDRMAALLIAAVAIPILWLVAYKRVRQFIAALKNVKVAIDREVAQHRQGAIEKSNGEGAIVRRRELDAAKLREREGAISTAGQILSRDLPESSIAEGGDDPEEIDMTKAEDVAWVQSQRDPALWHQAAMAVFAYVGDHHGFLPWLFRQPEMDRATAGWIFLWTEGSRYLRGDPGGTFPLDYFSGDEVISLFEAVCERSERAGFSHDLLGLDQDFEPERQACLAVVAAGEVADGITVPSAIIGEPFKAPIPPGRYEIDDGLLVSTSAAG